MKKFFFLASALFATMTFQAQTTVDFEELALPAESFYNGSDGNGSFTSNGVTLNTNYNTEWDFMQSGFAYSNQTDTETPGFTNEFSSITGGGADGSTIFAVNYSGDTLFFDESTNVRSVQITNTTYAYLSMRDGDDFAKKFGENGDKDFFYIHIIGHNAAGEIVETIPFYLADFRSDNAEDHYILNEWTTVDLTALENVKYITFEYFSSDEGEWGINTPVYFAMDNLIYGDYDFASVPTNEINAFKIYPNPASSQLTIEGASGEYSIYSTEGKRVLDFEVNQISNLDISTLKTGVYFVRNNKESTAQKLIIQ